MRARAVGAECARALEEREGFGRSGDATVFGRSDGSECSVVVGMLGFGRSGLGRNDRSREGALEEASRSLARDGARNWLIRYSNPFVDG